jgi:FkbM family methyltransferase
MKKYDRQLIDSEKTLDSLACQAHEILKIAKLLVDKGINLKTMYNFGVGQYPHQEASLVSDMIPGIKIYGLEPNPITYFDRLDDYPGVLLPLGVWSKEKILKLQMTSDHGRSSYLDPESTWKTENKVTIEHEVDTLCKTIDNLDTLFGSPENIILWMDIEGSELEALKGAHKLLESGRVEVIFLECTRANRQRRIGEPMPKELETFLENYNFKILEEDHTGGAENFINLIFYREK